MMRQHISKAARPSHFSEPSRGWRRRPPLAGRTARLASLDARIQVSSELHLRLRFGDVAVARGQAPAPGVCAESFRVPPLATSGWRDFTWSARERSALRQPGGSSEQGPIETMRSGAAGLAGTDALVDWGSDLTSDVLASAGVLEQAGQVVRRVTGGDNLDDSLIHLFD